MNPLDEPDKEYISVSPWSTILKYGLIGSALMLIWTVISITTGVGTNVPSDNTSIVVGILGFILSFGLYIVIMIFAVKEHRDKKQQGFISLGKGMAVSFVSGLIMAIVSNAVSLLYVFVINPNFYSDAMGGLDPSASIRMSDSSMKIAMLASTISTFFMGCVVGAVIALIISAVMKKERPYNLPPRPPMPPVQ